MIRPDTLYLLPKGIIYWQPLVYHFFQKTAIQPSKTCRGLISKILLDPPKIDIKKNQTYNRKQQGI